MKYVSMKCLLRSNLKLLQVMAELEEVVCFIADSQ